LQKFGGDAQTEHATDSLTPGSIDGTSQFVQAAPNPGQEFRAILGKSDCSCVTSKQWHTDVRLEYLDLGAHCSGRDTEFPRGSGEAQMGGDGLEDP
jgi:hypothetical protein